jgi:protein-S-isoprenylcysteine O-methyltransferase Ste14
VKIRIAATAICACWWIAEYVRSALGHEPARNGLDKGSSKVWDVGHLVGVIGIVIGFTSLGRIRRGAEFIAISGLAAMVSGVALRSLAIRNLGRYFSGIVQISEGHRLVQDGLYRHVRHPAYAASLLAYLGMGLAFANWISAVLIFVPILAAALYRMRVEEEALRMALGDQYADYSARTNRLVPRVY